MHIISLLLQGPNLVFMETAARVTIIFVIGSAILYRVTGKYLQCIYVCVDRVT